MRMPGQWLLCADGFTRPVVWATVLGHDGEPVADRFLIDSGADVTVFSADLRVELDLPTKAPPPQDTLVGIGGGNPYVMVSAVLELAQIDGGPVRVRGDYRAFLDVAATDMSILGRDVLANFDVILSRRRNEVVLLAGNSRYSIATGP